MSIGKFYVCNLVYYKEQLYTEHEALSFPPFWVGLNITVIVFVAEQKRLLSAWH